MGLEAVSTTSPYEIPRSFIRQSWRDVVFLHWRVAPDVVKPLLPPGVEPDVVDGATWVGVIGLRMTDLRVGPVPYPPFRELNVRLYGVDSGGRRGVVFRAMEASDPVFASAARAALRLPYTWAAFGFTSQHGFTGHDGVIGYRTRRQVPPPGGAGVRLRVRVGAVVGPSPAELAMTARWSLHQRWYGPTLRMPIQHDPWPLRAAEVLEWGDEGLLAACGLPTLERPPDSALYAARTDVRFGRPEIVRTTSQRRK